MQKLLFHLLLICIFMIFYLEGVAQNISDNPIERVQLPDQSSLISDYASSQSGSAEAEREAPKQELNDLQKEIMRRMNKIYEIHVDAVRDQINDDHVSAEENIVKALKAVQQLLEDYPEVNGDQRFTELYRTVYTEYRAFYGIEEADNQEKGEVFAVHRELYESEDDWMNGKYVMPENITTPKTEVPLVYNDQVNRHLAFYTRERPEVMDKWLKRSKKYFPMMERIFREEGVPTELIHLSMIESGLNPEARSWASAVGMWQFIQATGSAYGLEVNWWMDERRDPEKATRAAARHLKDLYEIWGDWHLAIANYNISPRGLKRAIRAGGGEENYWSAYPYLPRETQGYIPGFIATTIINRNAEQFGFTEKYDVKEYSYDIAQVAPLMPLDKLAEAAGISTEELKSYNPELLRWATPPGSKYPLKLPKGTKSNFLVQYEQIPKDQRSKGVAMHTVKRGETLGFIARRYGSTVRAIYETNEGLSSTIHPGQKIVVPVASGSSKGIASNKSGNRSKGSRSQSNRSSGTNISEGLENVSYTVKAGDTIGHIAEWYDVRSSQIRTWNRTSNYIDVGERLTIYVPEEKVTYYKQVNSFSFAKKQQLEREQRKGKNITGFYQSEPDEGGTVRYTVQKNDTLIKIARSFGVSVSELKEINDLNGSRIHVGQRLQIKTN